LYLEVLQHLNTRQWKLAARF